MKLNKNVVFSLALIVFAGVVIVLSMQLQSLFLSQSGDIGPKAFPIGAAAALILCAIGKMQSPSLTAKAGSGWASCLPL